MNSRASAAAIGGRPTLTPTKITPTARAPVKPSDLRVALFSGNYNYVRDGANQALNRLVGYLLRQGVEGARLFADGREPGLSADRRPGQHARRCRSPAGRNIACRSALPARVRRDLAEFDPNVVHISSPDIVGHRAVTWARRQQDRGRRLGPHALRNLPRLLSPAVARAAGRAASCAASITAARWSWRRPNRPRRSFARSG